MIWGFAGLQALPLKGIFTWRYVGFRVGSSRFRVQEVSTLMM